MTTLPGLVLLAALTADFSVESGRLRPELHSSGFGPQICSCPQEDIDDIKAMGFRASRTHDWSLINPNQRVCDYFHIFPLMHLDATDPKNYVFGPTDYLMKRTRDELGHDIFFRLGTSIEHSGKVHFNALIPEDFDKTAEIFAATVRHYNRGWANGYRWGIRYWEIWNEPDGHGKMWCLPEGDGSGKEALEKSDRKRLDLFVRFFVTCVKRIKAEFPEVKVGGPALCALRRDYFKALLEGCRAAGIAPDFISWHDYGDSPKFVLDEIKAGRELCDSLGFPDCELILNEWHFFNHGLYSWADLRSPDPEVQKRVWSSPGSHNGIESSCYNLTLLSKFQRSGLGQGYYYGCRNSGSWGFKDALNAKYKVFYGLRLFGGILRDYTRLCASTDHKTVSLLAVASEDGRRRALLVTDYRGTRRELKIAVKGIPSGSKVSAVVHDHTRDCAPADFAFENGQLILKKADSYSAAFLVTFE